MVTSRFKEISMSVVLSLIIMLTTIPNFLLAQDTKSDTEPLVYALPLARSGMGATYGLAIAKANQNPDQIIKLAKWILEESEQVQQKVEQDTVSRESDSLIPVSENEQSRFGGRLLSDPKTGLPSRITGMSAIPQAIRRKQMTFVEPYIEENIRSFLLDNEDYLGVPSNALKLNFIRQRDNIWYIKFDLLYKNIPVWNGSVGLVADSEGVINQYSSNYDPAIDALTTPEITLDEAVKIAKTTYDTVTVNTFFAHRSELVIYPESRDNEIEYHLAWKFLLRGEESNTFLDKNFIIDALSGVILLQFDQFVNIDVNGRVRGQIYPVNPTFPPVTASPLSHAKISVQHGSSVNTGDNGYYKGTTSSTGSFDVTSSLSGPHAYVMDFSGSVNTSMTNSGQNTTGRDFFWTATDRDHINVFYHMNLFHDWFEDWLNHSWYKNVIPMGALVNVTENGRTWNNASADGEILNFGADDFARSSDVIYHEYTHNIIYEIFDGWIGLSEGKFTEGYGMDEGFADYFACAITNDSRHGEGHGGSRDLDNWDQYPGPVGYHIEGHTAGEIIAGAAWDLRESFNNDQAIDNLVLHTLIHLATMSKPYYFSRPIKSNFLTAMKDAAQLIKTYTMPEEWQINQAFRNHDLLPVDIYIKDYRRDDGDVPSNPSGENISDSPDIRIDAPPYNKTDDDEPVKGQVNRVYITIRNNGYNVANNVYLALYDKPKYGSWQLVKKVLLSSNTIPVSGHIEVSVDWTPPMIWENSLLVKVYSQDDPITKDWDVALENNIAKKNLKLKDDTPPLIFNIYSRDYICIVNNKCLPQILWDKNKKAHYFTNADVSAEITDNTSGVYEVECLSRFCESGGSCSAWTEAKLTSQSGDQYYWDLGGTEKVGRYEYKIKATDRAGNKTVSSVHKIEVTNDCDKCNEYEDIITIYSLFPIWGNIVPIPKWLEFERKHNFRINFISIPQFDYTESIIAAFENDKPPEAVLVDMDRLQRWGDMGLLKHFLPLNEILKSHPELLNAYLAKQLSAFSYTSKTN